MGRNQEACAYSGRLNAGRWNGIIKSVMRLRMRGRDARFEKQQSGMMQKYNELAELLGREQENYEQQLDELKSEVFKSKKTLKEMGEIMKQKSRDLQLIFRKKELEITQEGIVARLDRIVR